MGKKARPGLYQCSELACRRQFTATTKTPFHATKLALRAWLTAFWMQLHSDKGISSVRLAEAVGVTQSTAWRMGHAFRVLMANRETKLGGIVEADDVKIGGKPRKDPANPDARKGMQGQSTKRPALVAVERPRARPRSAPPSACASAMRTAAPGRARSSPARTGGASTRRRKWRTSCRCRRPPAALDPGGAISECCRG
jgi:hypothetical protein